MFRMVPPAGMPITQSDIIKIMLARFNHTEASKSFNEMIKEVSGAKYCEFVSSGRAANYIILKTLKALADNARDEVVILAYTCFSVPASIARAGLKIRMVDINPDTLDYDYKAFSKIDLSRVLAILPCNLFGIVSDWIKLQEVAVSSDAYLVDDSAQTLGLSSDEKGAAGPAMAGFYSFGRGKNLSLYSGGAIFTSNDKLASLIKSKIASLHRGGMFAELKILIKFWLYAIMLKPSLYWIPDSLPLGLGKTIYEENFDIGKLTDLQQSAGPVMFSKLKEANSFRMKNSNIIARALRTDDRFGVPGWHEGAAIPFIRLPVLAANADLRDKAVKTLKSKGISASIMYPTSIAKIPGIEKHLVPLENNFEGAENVASNLFTLPTHSYLNSADIDKMIDCLKAL